MSELQEFHKKLLKELFELEGTIKELKHNKSIKEETYNNNLNKYKEQESKLKKLNLLKKEMPIKKHPIILFISGIITTIISIISCYLYILSPSLDIITKIISSDILSIFIGIPIIIMTNTILSIIFIKKLQKKINY